MYTRDIKQWIFSLHEEELILAKSAYEKYFTSIKEATFYQLLARLNSEKVIGKIAKGLYYKPRKDDFDALPSDEKLLNFFTNKFKNGMLIGAHMLKNYGIINDVGNIYELYTNMLEIKTRRFISNLEIETVDIDYKNPQLVKTIEVLELIEIIDKYKEVNYEAIAEMLRSYAAEYNEDQLFKVLMVKSYKKRNIAALKVILDTYHVKNNLSRQLNSASKYEFPKHLVKALELKY